MYFNKGISFSITESIALRPLQSKVGPQNRVLTQKLYCVHKFEWHFLQSASPDTENIVKPLTRQQCLIYCDSTQEEGNPRGFGYLCICDGEISEERMHMKVSF